MTTSNKNRKKSLREIKDIEFKNSQIPKGTIRENMLNGEKYFIDCQFCDKRIEGKKRDIEQNYKNHLENWHKDKKENLTNQEKNIMGKI